MNHKQKGRFTIDGLTMAQNLGDCATAMSGLVIQDARHAAAQDAIEYIAIGPEFDEIEQGALIPEYMAIMDCDEEGVVTLKEWRKL